MPTTFVGLLIFVAFLTPGFLYTSVRRRLAPQSERSALSETTSVVTISLATNAVVVGVFGLVRWIAPSDTPDVGALLEDRASYWRDHLAYVTAWSGALLVASCVLAVVAARWEGPRKAVDRVLVPTIIDESAWSRVFSAPEGCYVFAHVEMLDGGAVSGRVVWFNTEVRETVDRDVVLGPPLSIRGTWFEHELGAERVIISARVIQRIDVSYVVERVPAEA